MSREPSTSNMEPSPHWSSPQVVDGSPLPRLPKETGWPHCHQAQSVAHHNPELHQVQDCFLTNSVSSHVPAWTEIPFHAPPVHLLTYTLAKQPAWRTTPWTSSTRRSTFRIAHLFSLLLINHISLGIVSLMLLECITRDNLHISYGS